jgi:hypothetical protein
LDYSIIIKKKRHEPYSLYGYFISEIEIQFYQIKNSSQKYHSDMLYNNIHKCNRIIRGRQQDKVNTKKNQTILYKKR